MVGPKGAACRHEVIGLEFDHGVYGKVKERRGRREGRVMRERKGGVERGEGEGRGVEEE